MAKGLSQPVVASKSGGLLIEEDPEHLNSLLKAELSPGEDDNPFQALGINEAIIFALNDPSAHGVARSAVKKIIAKYADRVALDPSTPIEIRPNQEGESNLFFRYIDLQTNKINDFNEALG